MINTQIKVPVILGPTAVGKTALSLKLAEQLGWEILSCDSRQVYKKMNIGTAKPDRNQLNKIQHWLIDIIDPDETYSAFRFAEEAEEIIRKRAAAGKTVLICGGTGLYFRSLSEGPGIQVQSDPLVREQLMKRAEVAGSLELYNELKSKDPESSVRIHPNDLQRIVRALAVYYQTGVPYSEAAGRGKKVSNDIEYEVVKIFDDRDTLYQRINKRVQEMIDNGLWGEFLELLKNGYNQKSPGLQCVGYQELFAHYRKECTMQQSIELIQRNSRRYAKRQITWFSHQVHGTVFEAHVDYSIIRDYFLSRI